MIDDADDAVVADMAAQTGPIRRLKVRFGGRSAHLIRKGMRATYRRAHLAIDLAGIGRGAWRASELRYDPRFPAGLQDEPPTTPTCKACERAAAREASR